MDVADDEGPIILLPGHQRSYRTNKASNPYPLQLFENPLWLVAHLIEYGDDLNREFWLGICETSPECKAGVATSGVWYFKDVLNGLGGMNCRSLGPARVKKEAQKFASMTYGAIAQPPLTAVDIIIENTGVAFGDIADAFGDIPRSIMISRA